MTLQEALLKAGVIEKVPSQKEKDARYLGSSDKTQARELLSKGNEFARLFNHNPK